MSWRTKTWEGRGGQPSAFQSRTSTGSGLVDNRFPVLEAGDEGWGFLGGGGTLPKTRLAPARPRSGTRAGRSRTRTCLLGVSRARRPCVPLVPNSSSAHLPKPTTTFLYTSVRRYGLGGSVRTYSPFVSSNALKITAAANNVSSATSSFRLSIGIMRLTHSWW